MFSANSSQVSDEKLYVEDVFSTWLYTGTGSAQTITNGIDLAGRGGMVWSKARDQVYSEGNCIADTARGAGNDQFTSQTYGYNTGSITSFNSNGFSLSGGIWRNSSGNNYASWTFRKAPKFFDVVTYTGDGNIRTIAHNLGVAPGCIIIKATSAADNWSVYHRGIGGSYSAQQQAIFLNLTNAAFLATYWNDTAPTATNFTLGTAFKVNEPGVTYVAYLFAHDTTSDGIIQCGSYTGNGSSTGPSVTLGWEPQWLLVKDATTASYDWRLVDNMRGMPVGSGAPSLFPNLSNAEFTSSLIGFDPTATGFQVAGSHGSINASGSTYIYIAIRRGPMRIPTSGTSVFAPVSQAGGGTITTNFPVDLVLTAQNTLVGDKYSLDRLRGSVSTSSKYLITNKTDAEATVGAGFGLDNNLGYKDNGLFSASYNSIYWNFRRAPSFFDEVCYTGTGVARTINHNLGVAPELMIVKIRTPLSANWLVYSAPTGSDKSLTLNSTSASVSPITYWNSTSPTSSVFSLGTSSAVNGSGYTHVAYLFASCPGVSKIGSYTGNGSSQTINCGFAAGARFVMIKRTDSTGDWYVWDTARGIVAGNDPHLSLNTTAAEVTTDDSVDTDSSGFVVNQVAATNVNVNNATYIYLAIA